MSVTTDNPNWYRDSFLLMISCTCLIILDTPNNYYNYIIITDHAWTQRTAVIWLDPPFTCSGWSSHVGLIIMVTHRGSTSML